MSKKDAYWFSHDANAQDDPKCMLLIDQLGMEGYGIFWSLIEKLRSEKEYVLPLSVIPSLAKRWSTSPEKVFTVVKNFNLFVLTQDGFFSHRLRESMILKSSKARESALSRWGDANALLPDANVMRNDAIKGKESKIKETKELDFLFAGDFKPIWEKWIEYKSQEHRERYKMARTEQAAIKNLFELSSGDQGIAEKIVDQSISNRWKGLFPLKNNQPNKIVAISAYQAEIEKQRQAARNKTYEQ